MSNGERFFIWLLIVVAIAVGSYVIVEIREENKELRSALYRAHQNQDQLNANFKQFTQATEQQFSHQAGEIHSISSEIRAISSRIGPFRATKDSESGAVIWD